MRDDNKDFNNERLQFRSVDFFQFSFPCLRLPAKEVTWKRQDQPQLSHQLHADHVQAQVAGFAVVKFCFYSTGAISVLAILLAMYEFVLIKTKIGVRQAAIFALVYVALMAAFFLNDI